MAYNRMRLRHYKLFDEGIRAQRIDRAAARCVLP